jgi:hypothetical protein
VPGHGRPNQLLAHQLLSLQSCELGAHQERRRTDIGGDLKVIERPVAESAQDPLPYSCVGQSVPSAGRLTGEMARPSQFTISMIFVSRENGVTDFVQLSVRSAKAE